MNPWPAIIATYGLQFAIELAKLIEQKDNPTSADFIALKSIYGSKSADDYLKAAPAPPPSA